MFQAAVDALLVERLAHNGIPTLDLFAEEKVRARRGAQAGARRPAEPENQAPHARRPGASIHDTYRMGKLIGKGGFSSVFRARHLETGRSVAVKVALQRPSVVAEAQAEASLLRGLTHPNVVELVELIWTGESDVYLVQELVDGGSLADYLRERAAPLHEPEARHLTRQLFCGLEYLHAQGIIHRDIKPANLLLQIDGAEAHVLKISDFGLSTLSYSTTVEGGSDWRLTVREVLLSADLTLSAATSRACCALIDCVY
jgi:serine/threonine protein kinase